MLSPHSIAFIVVQYVRTPHHQYAAHGSSTSDDLHSQPEEDTYEVQYSQSKRDPSCSQDTQWHSNPTVQVSGSVMHHMVL